MVTRIGQKFKQYTEEIKKEAVRLREEEGWINSPIMEKFGVKSESQIITWVRKIQNERALRISGDDGTRSI